MPDTWQHLRRFTDARIALGSAGSALPTSAQLDLAVAHAMARDAIYVPLEVEGLLRQIRSAISVHSAAANRDEYLKRPDLGRKLSSGTIPQTSSDILFVIADGLSPLAVNRHAAPLLEHTLPLLNDFTIAPVVIAQQGRVAIGDDIGQRAAARMVIVFIGERPGLSSPDSLGVYLTYAPKPGRTDAERNCISNVRAEGLSYAAAAHRIAYLVREALRRGLTGVALKDDSTPRLEVIEDGQ